MAKTYFITGTDTSVGKTCVSAAFLHLAAKAGLSTAAVKPLAAGCEQTEQGLRNEDALILQEECTLTLDYQQINPVALEPAIAPHIAAEREGRRLSNARLAGYCRGVMMSGADFVVIEGAGGWRVPINSVEKLSGLAKELKLPVIMVVGIRLGCINHALLTAEAIAHDGLTIAGWVANCCDAEMPAYLENIRTLKHLIPAPCLGEVPRLENSSPSFVANYLNISNLSQ